MNWYAFKIALASAGMFLFCAMSVEYNSRHGMGWKTVVCMAATALCFALVVGYGYALC